MKAHLALCGADAPAPLTQDVEDREQRLRTLVNAPPVLGAIVQGVNSILHFLDPSHEHTRCFESERATCTSHSPLICQPRAASLEPDFQSQPSTPTLSPQAGEPHLLPPEENGGQISSHLPPPHSPPYHSPSRHSPEALQSSEIDEGALPYLPGAGVLVRTPVRVQPQLLEVEQQSPPQLSEFKERPTHFPPEILPQPHPSQKEGPYRQPERNHNLPPCKKESSLPLSPGQTCPSHATRQEHCSFPFEEAQPPQLPGVASTSEPPEREHLLYQSEELHPLPAHQEPLPLLPPPPPVPFAQDEESTITREPIPRTTSLSSQKLKWQSPHASPGTECTDLTADRSLLTPPMPLRERISSPEPPKGDVKSKRARSPGSTESRSVDAKRARVYAGDRSKWVDDLSHFVKEVMVCALRSEEGSY